MNWQFLLKLLALMQIFKLSENSHVQLAKQHLQTEVNASIGHLPSPSPPPLAAVSSSSAHPFYHHHLHKRHSQQFGPPLPPSQQRQYHQHWQRNGQRAERRHYRLHHHRPHNRWVPRRHHHHHHSHAQYTPWTAWSPCSPECLQRRERYCKTKRKCGHIKHIEERKCWRCHPAWPATSSSLPPHAVQQQQQQQQQQQSQQVNSGTPTIVINAAAAAATAPVSATSAITQPESHHHHDQQQHPTPEIVLPTELNNIHHPVTIHPHDLDEDDEDHHATSHFKDDTSDDYDDEDNDETDFYIVKTKRKRKHHHKRKPQLNEFEDYLEYGEVAGGLTSKEQQQDDLRDLGLATSTELLDPSSSEVRSIQNQKFLPSTSANQLRSMRQREKKRSRGHRQGRHNSRRNLKGAVGVYDDGAIEGDVFQYEDFDIDISRAEHQYGDVSYEDPVDEDAGNSSNLTPSKERATPEHLIPKHRRIYSKWSRWTKCSPKCTTRRYKKCRVREQCGREVLREIAYCYTEGSFCQQWLQAQVQKSPSYDMRPVATRRRDISDDGGTLSNSIGGTLSDFIMNGKGYRGPEYTPMKLKCGIAPIRSNKRNMYNMLKIIGGKAARKGEWPWQVAIFNRYKEAFCGGTLIAPQWVLTAAHCVRKVLYVRIGEHNLDYEDGTEMQVKVLKSFKHPNFDKKTVDSDVALLKLPKPINGTTWIGFSCLPRPYQPLPKNMDCTVIGWGKRRNRDIAGTSVLHQAEVPIIPMDNCRSVYHDYTITKNMFCAGHKRGRIDTCAGDSGGPLLCRDTTKPNHPWTIFGITSFGDGCAKRNKFGIYAKVPNYVDWVWSVINCNGNCKMHQRST
ncbi:uncharacterized protein LOC135953707 [Calliphora vicina]|uniref:uncharacterized protein LOC135953707 n=1 Tax=Calliphora vicina TaxID=7373 RepID=UPI00325B6D5E